MTSTYFLNIVNDDDSTTLAMAYGDLAEVSFIARRQIPKLTDSSARFSVTLVEVREIGQMDDDHVPTDTVREVTSFTGKGKQAAMVLKSELADERKQAAEAEQEQPAGEADTEPEADVQL